MRGTMLQEESGYMLQTNVRKWGNSQGIRLSKEVMSQMGLKENDPVSIRVCDGKMTVEKLNGQKNPSLKERLETFYQKPIDEIYVDNTQEVEMGEPVGDEIW